MPPGRPTQDKPLSCEARGTRQRTAGYLIAADAKTEGDTILTESDYGFAEHGTAEANP